MLIGSVLGVPNGISGSNSHFNATQMLLDAHINPITMMGVNSRNSRLPEYIGARLQNTWHNLGQLYNKYVAQGRLDPVEMREFGTARKLLQLAQMVRETQNGKYLFERYCFYGCHCLPTLPLHDSTAGKGVPQDGIDGICSSLRQCYHCAKADDEEEDCDGTTMSYSYGFIDNDKNGKTDDIECSNKPGTCRWRLCQCDRQFALRLRDVEHQYDQNYAGSEDGSTGFNRAGECTAGAGGGGEKACCGNYKNNFRLVYNKNSQVCCSEKYSTIKNRGEC